MRCRGARHNGTIFNRDFGSAGVRHGETLSDSLSQSASPDSHRLGTITYAFRYHSRLERGEAGGRHGSRAIVMAPRHSAPNHYFDMGAWRPARLILPSGSSFSK